MNTAKLVNSALTGGGLIYPENLNVIIGSENKGYPKGTVLDANATLSLAGQASSGSGSQTPGQQGSNPNNTSSGLDKYIKPNEVLQGNDADNPGNKFYVRSLDMLSDRQNGFLSIDLQNKEYPADFSLNYISGSANFNLGSINVILGKNNLGIGSGIYSTNNSLNNILLGSRFTIQVNKNPGGKLRLVVKKGSSLEYLLKEDLLGITDRFAINYIDDKFVFKKVFDTEVLIRTSSSFIRIDDNTIEMNNVNLNKLNEYDFVVALSVTSDGLSNISCGVGIFNGGSSSIIVGTALKSTPSPTGKQPNNIQCFGIGNKVSNNCEFASGAYNITNNKTVGNYQYNTVFSIGAGSLSKGNLNALELIAKKNTTDKTSINALYVNGVGGYDGTNVSDDNTKSLQQVISDIETAVSLNSNGPWDVDITSEFVNGNVTIKPLSMWSISQGVKRVYFTTNLKQGDIITIPDTLRMYIGWKISDNRFGMADWTAAGKKYTVTTDSYYVILIATENDNPGVQTNNLPSFGKVMLRTSNPEFKPTAQTETKKDHTNDDKVMRGIAHQGFHKTERANSLAAFRAAAKEGWRYVETDTYMTKDGKFIVSHDDNIPVGYTNGTTTLTDTSYKYEQHTLDEILAFHGPNGEKVDTLEDFCKLCKQCGLHPYIEIKQGNMWQANTIDTTNAKYNGKPYAIKLLDIVNRYGLRGNATFISSTPYTLRLMAQKDQSYRYGIVYFGNLKITDTNLTTLISKIEEFNNDTDASKAYLFVDVNIDNLKTADANIVNLFVSRNCALEVWTAKTKEDLDNLDPYVTGVTSDNIHAGEILAKKI